MEQVQCPNCGGYRVKESPIRDKSGRKQYEPAHPIVVILSWIGFLISFAFIIGPLCLFWEENRKMLFSGQQLVGARTVGYEYACELCNYRWTWMVGTPKPEAHVRPNLIEMGAQRLREEEEEARRRRD